ncbi:MAG: DnaJ domain-containing protein [Cyanobacteria bacterium P01_H01_bin.15]
MLTSLYHILEVPETASQEEIKRAYRRLVKEYHPDRQDGQASDVKTIELNAAYEILGDPERRRHYDHKHVLAAESASARRQARTATAQEQYQRSRANHQQNISAQKIWLKQSYQPTRRRINKIINPLKTQLRALSSDPFDDKLLAVFCEYLETCRTELGKARQAFASFPNPPQCAGIAANIYYCLNQISDGIEELGYFPLNYDDQHLHTGQELFRIAKERYGEAQTKVRLLNNL